MEFTEREIALATDMKEAGIEWKPEVGDWFIDGANTRRLVTRIVDHEYGNEDDRYRIWTRYDNYSWDARHYIWLPFWHKGRQILSDNNIIINSFDLQHHIDDNIEIICYRVSKDDRQGRYELGSIKARTDMEALYQAILLFVLPEKE